MSTTVINLRDTISLMLSPEEAAELVSLLSAHPPGTTAERVAAMLGHAVLCLTTKGES